MAGFNALRAPAEKSAPFGQDIRLSIGEGAGIMILTRADIGALPLAGRILGYGLSGDAYHATALDQDGQGRKRDFRCAERRCNRGVRDWLRGRSQGTGTENDGAESRLATLFGNSVPVSSTKGYYGHTLGASVIETISSILMGVHGKARKSAY